MYLFGNVINGQMCSEWRILYTYIHIHTRSVRYGICVHVCIYNACINIAIWQY